MNDEGQWWFCGGVSWSRPVCEIRMMFNWLGRSTHGGRKVGKDECVGRCVGFRPKNDRGCCYCGG
jgi:hypothetical protein